MTDKCSKNEVTKYLSNHGNRETYEQNHDITEWKTEQETICYILHPLAWVDGQHDEEISNHAKQKEHH